MNKNMSTNLHLCWTLQEVLNLNVFMQPVLRVPYALGLIYDMMTLCYKI